MTKRKGKAVQDGFAVVYARYSSHNQREASIEQQIGWCMELAKRHSLDVIEVYSDKAITGRTDKRPNFQRMLRDAEAGRFGYVLAWKSDRMGRNMLQALQVQEALKESGISCLYVEQNFEDTAAGRFASRNMMNVNQFYSESMAEDVRRGMLDNAQKCMVNGRLPYGYRKSKDGKYEINEEQAEIVREIFERIRQGWAQIDIMTDLNNRNIRNRDGKLWQRTVFDKLLRCEQYIGVYKFSDIRIEGGVPAILDKKTFEEVQRILETKKHPRGRKRLVAEYILTGKLFCGHCQRPMVGISGTSRNGEKHYYYSCQGKRTDEGAVCDKKNERKEQIEGYVIEVVKGLIMSDKTMDWIMDGYKKFIEKLREESALREMEDELSDVEKGLSNLMKAIEAGIITDTTKDRLLELEKKKKFLTKSIEEERLLTEEISFDEMRFILEKNRERFINSREYQKDLIQLFIQAIYVYDDHLRIVVNRGLGDPIEVPYEFVESVDESEAVCSYKLHQAPPKQDHTNQAEVKLFLHQHGIILVVPY